MIASRRSDITEIPAVQTLLACGANPFFVSPSGDSPLIAAVKHLGMMKEEIVSALLESIAQRKEKYPLSLLEPIILRAIGIISEAEDVAARRQNISPELLKLMCEKIMGINLRAEDGSARHQDIPPESIEWVVATIRAINDPAGDEYPQPPFIPLEEIDYTVARARGTDNPAGDPPWLLPFIPIDAIQLVIGEVMENHKPLDPAGDRTARHLWSVKKLITQFYWRLKYPVPT
ncbi:uncharacterized protein BDV14DRAFT_184970 [Aspergillus stella-maris]|uniref:uncharacterized protein n=1 Tax=Aspergillus stella-maris TaxID=1810926 RepID=UPI003CCDA490